MTVAGAVAQDARPPLLLVRLLNPAMRVLLRSPIGRLVRPFALLEFRGRRTGCRHRVAVGWHDTGSGPFVCTPARWRVNFRDGIPVIVHHRGHRRELTGSLVDDPEVVAAELQRLIDQRRDLRSVGVDIPPGHRITATDVRAVDRALVRFTPSATSSPNAVRRSSARRRTRRTRMGRVAVQASPRS
jgi:hypothetical protein